MVMMLMGSVDRIGVSDLDRPKPISSRIYSIETYLPETVRFISSGNFRNGSFLVAGKSDLFGSLSYSGQLTPETNLFLPAVGRYTINLTFARNDSLSFIVVIPSTVISLPGLTRTFYTLVMVVLSVMAVAINFGSYNKREKTVFSYAKRFSWLQRLLRQMDQGMNTSETPSSFDKRVSQEVIDIDQLKLPSGETVEEFLQNSYSNMNAFGPRLVGLGRESALINEIHDEKERQTAVALAAAIELSRRINRELTQFSPSNFFYPVEFLYNLVMRRLYIASSKIIISKHENLTDSKDILAALDAANTGLNMDDSYFAVLSTITVGMLGFLGISVLKLPLDYLALEFVVSFYLFTNFFMSLTIFINRRVA